mmetsp:Transcript_25086/g.47980  ORF Transcript_25086/g.47980 Transcript_25086/m.47980 type:complete len:347 (-) Transcript_25086:894-1934(-)
MIHPNLSPLPHKYTANIISTYKKNKPLQNQCSSSSGSPPIRKPLQPRNHIPTHDPPIRRRKNITVHPIHNPPVFRNQIPKVLQTRIPLEHARRQIAHQPQQRQRNSVNRAQHKPVRPFLYPSAQCCQKHTKCTSADDALDRFIWTGLSCSGADGAELGFAKFTTSKVPPHVAEGYAEPRPEYEVSAGRNREMDGFGEEGGKFLLSEAVEEGFDERGEAGRLDNVSSEFSYANPKGWNVSQIKHASKRSSNLPNSANASTHRQKPNHRPRARHWQDNLMQIRSEQRRNKHGARAQHANPSCRVNARLHDHAVVFELTQGRHEGEEGGEYVVAGVDPAGDDHAHGEAE